MEADDRDRPLLIYDGDCGFCRGWVARWRSVTGSRVRFAPYQQVADQFPGIPLDRFVGAVHLVDPDGTIASGAEAVFRTLGYVGRRRVPLWMYRHVPGFAWASELGYRTVANHRGGLSRATRWLRGPSVKPSSYLLTRWLFVRLLGVIFGIAFASLGVQILGLVGSHGILPATDYLETATQRFGQDAYWRVPTIFWLTSSDAALQAACWIGVGLSALVVLRIAPGPILLVLWGLYLSLYHVGQTFLSFQWDILLLESGVLGVLIASWKLHPKLSTDAPPSNFALWLIRLLLFKLMFLSGVVKLLDDNPSDPTWHNLTALTFHYETQCIPNAVSWYVYQLPVWFHKFSVVSMFVIEIGLPFLIFAPRRLRIFSFFPIVFLQLLIILTGNYNFFNLLAITLCITLLDDAFLRRLFAKRTVVAAKPRRSRPTLSLVRRVMTVGLGAALIGIGGLTIAMSRVGFRGLPPAAQRIVRATYPFMLSSPYGLFRQMTTRRPEIIVEGSNDGRDWKAYEFKWKPGNVKRRPSEVAPHQPRLDWQMWFAALGDIRRNSWFAGFLHRLLEGSPEVLALLDTNPFPKDPPKLIRATLYDYHFTDPAAHEKDGAWWTRRRLRPYAPVLSLKSFRRE